MKLETNLANVDEHYAKVCKAILQTNGIMVADLDSHNIFTEYQKLNQNNFNKLQDRKAKKQQESQSKMQRVVRNGQDI